MRRAAFLLLICIAHPALAQPARPTSPAFSLSLVTAVIAAALDFIEPRALQATSVQQLTLWGLRGLTALDPALTPVLRDGSLRLLAGEQVLLEMAIADDAAVSAWAAAAGQLARTASLASPVVRDAGSLGVLQSFFDELFNHLDPYSRYLPPDVAETDRSRRSGEAGIGVAVARRGGDVVVREVSPDGPAAEAGIRRGDRILAIDDQPVRGLDPAAVADLLSGEEGSLLALRVRGRSGRTVTVELERVVIAPETVFADRAGDGLLLRVSSFNRDTAERLGREIARGLSGPGRRVRGIVLDLRGNRGGLLRQAVAATDLLLNGGLVAITAGRNPQASHEWFASGRDVSAGRPVVVLVDGRSASAAEIMAAALADRGRAVVVGSSTLGKGLVQTIANLPDGGELFVTWSRVLAPGGWPIQGLGVLPQVCTSMGQSVLDQQLAALGRGEQTMSGALDRHRTARAPLPAAQIVELRQACPAAEGREADLAAAQFLIARPAAYEAALLPAAARATAGR